MKIAIIGAGFAGLAVCYHLLKEQDVDVTLYDKVDIGAGASGVAAGLLHMYGGVRSNRTWEAERGMESALQLIKVAETALGESVITGRGILRIATNARQHHAFSRCARKFDDVTWWEADQCVSQIPELTPDYPGLFIPEGCAIDCARYVKGLWLACQKLGAVFQQSEITDLKALDGYDAIVLTMGAATAALVDLPLQPIKGQLVTFKWPDELAPLPFALNSSGYLSMASSHTCIAGATFDKVFSTPDPTPDAIATIRRKIALFYPPILDFEVIESQTGIRAATPDHRPIAKQVTDNCWVLTGLGSKGLLHHSWLAERIAADIL